MSLSLLVLLLNLLENKPQKSPALMFTKSHGNCFDYYGCHTLLNAPGTSTAHGWVQDWSWGELCCQDAHREMRKTSCCFPEPGSITWLPRTLHTFCLFVITGCWQLKWGRARGWEVGTSEGNGSMCIPCSHGGIMLPLAQETALWAELSGSLVPG